ncbi:hypothetical protein [Ktedonospora formicarum]|uniref:Uncharacterized protein n=1 Tax=Ktedonospora formicarum TaxID=2778364 RepID=A0A8J3MUC9_9CHLR|nr:hypothetical protein [Ktedonospora formicarum]GHO46796.1 hypothetical protein KSX_49590 [Ktedonospora formicarum]
MSLIALFKRPSAQPPVEVIQAACAYYGQSPERVSSVRAEKLRALSNDMWVVRLNERQSAVVAYTPNERERAVAAAWFNE